MVLTAELGGINYDDNILKAPDPTMTSIRIGFQVHVLLNLDYKHYRTTKGIVTIFVKVENWSMINISIIFW